ncbi:MAG: hypothetical protein WC712_03255 [Candidatus Brocadiia bacterium]
MRILASIVLAAIMLTNGCFCYCLETCGYYLQDGSRGRIVNPAENMLLIASPSTTSLFVIQREIHGDKGDWDPVVSNRVRGFISSCLAGKGYRIVDSEAEADYIVSYSWSIRRYTDSKMLWASVTVEVCNSHKVRVWEGDRALKYNPTADSLQELRKASEKSLSHWGKSKDNTKPVFLD